MPEQGPPVTVRTYHVNRTEAPFIQLAVGLNRLWLSSRTLSWASGAGHSGTNAVGLWQGNMFPARGFTVVGVPKSGVWDASVSDAMSKFISFPWSGPINIEVE